MFSESIRNTVEHLQDLLSQESLKDVKTILLVGGFSESRILQEAIKKEFSEKVVVRPENSGMAIVLGKYTMV